MFLAAALAIGASLVSSQPAAAATWTETTGPATNKTFTYYQNAGAPLGAEIAPYSTLQISCRIEGLRLSDGNTWWYRIASSPWNGAFYATADAFYNNGATSGSLAGTPFVDTNVRSCNDPEPAPPPPTSGTIINGINVGLATNDRHAWGKCTVQDFDTGPYGHVIVDYTYGVNVVRNGMQWGWFDRGGAPGFGCARGSEYPFWKAYRQDFGNGQLYWATGMDHAKQYVTTCLWPARWNKLTLTYKYSGTQRYLGNVKQAAKNWTDSSGGISIVPATGQAADIEFKDVNDSKSKEYAAVTDSIPGSWRFPRADANTKWNTLGNVSIRVNQYEMDTLTTYLNRDRTAVDAAKTSILTHELGHALGLAHSNADECGLKLDRSIMKSTNGSNRTFETIQNFDIMELREMYGLPL